MLDLAQDGFLGTATFELPPAAAKTSVSALHHNDPGQADVRLEVLIAPLCASPGRVNYRTVSFEVQPTLKIIAYHNTRSSGGIPH
jgi:hypothetical protein